MARKQSIAAALKDRKISMALNGLVGLPVGGWPETQQAKGELLGELPLRQDRDYTVGQLIEHALYEKGGDAQACGHFAWRDESAQPTEPVGS